MFDQRQRLAVEQPADKIVHRFPHHLRRAPAAGSSWSSPPAGRADSPWPSSGARRSARSCSRSAGRPAALRAPGGPSPRPGSTRCGRSPIRLSTVRLAGPSSVWVLWGARVSQPIRLGHAGTRGRVKPDRLSPENLLQLNDIMAYNCTKSSSAEKNLQRPVGSVEVPESCAACRRGWLLAEPCPLLRAELRSVIRAAFEPRHDRTQQNHRGHQPDGGSDQAPPDRFIRLLRQGDPRRCVIACRIIAQRAATKRGGAGCARLAPA